MKKVIVLGGGIDQVGLITDLKSRGYYVILIDYYLNPIAKPFADKHIQESTLDQEMVLKIAEEESVENILTACTDQALLTVAYVAEKLGFHTQFTYSQAKNLTNKLCMKRIMVDAGIPTASYVNIHDLQEGIGKLTFPLMVKPADCNGSFGVRKVHDWDELREGFENAVSASRTHSAIIEEFKEGMEVSVDAFIVSGSVHVLMHSLIKKKSFDDSVSIIYQTLIPAPISELARVKIYDVIKQIVRAFHLDNTPLLIQLIINGDEVNVIEFSARIGGGLKYKTIKSKTGFDILHANIDCILGNPIHFYTDEDSNFYSRTHLYCYPSTFNYITDYIDLLNEGVIDELSPTKSSGMKILGATASRDRVGSFLVKAQTINELSNKINIALGRIKVIDKEGNDVLNRSIYQ